MQSYFKKGYNYFFSNKLYVKRKNKTPSSLSMEAYAEKLDGIMVRRLSLYDVYFVVFEGKYFSVLPKWCTKKRIKNKRKGYLWNIKNK